MTRRVVMIQKQGPAFRSDFKIDMTQWEPVLCEPLWIKSLANALFIVTGILAIAVVVSQLLHATGVL